MKTTKRASWTGIIYLLACFTFAAGCGGNGGGGISPGPCDAPFDTNLTGTWQVTETDLGNDCGDPIEPPEVEDVTVDQAGSTLLITSDDGTESFQLCGNEMLIPGGQEPEHGGITTTAPWVVTFTSPTTFSGTATYVWTDGVDVCTGSYMVEGTKL